MVKNRWVHCPGVCTNDSFTGYLPAFRVYRPRYCHCNKSACVEEWPLGVGIDVGVSIGIEVTD